MLSFLSSFNRIDSRIDNIVSLINIMGALLTFFYFNIIDPLPRGVEPFTRLESDDPGLFLLAVVITFTVVARWRAHYYKPISTWVNRLSNGARVAEVPDKVRRAVLNLPAFTAAPSGVMWILVGIFFAWLAQSYRQFVGIALVGGIFTTSLLYLVVDLLWRPVIPFFFPEGQISSTKAFRLPVLGRLLLVFALIGFLPPTMLLGLSWSRAQALLSAPSPMAVLNNMFYLQIFVLVVSLVASVSLAIFVTHSITVPLKSLQIAMARVEQSDLNVQAPVTLNDELGYLTERFNAMVEGLRQAERLRQLFGLYVSPEVARRAIETGAGLGGELVTCTILFSDLRGFTHLAEQMPPKQLIGLINRYMSRMVKVVTANGGIVTKFGGDSLMVVFGSPLNPSKDHAVNAVNAALEMDRELAVLNQEQISSHLPTLKMGIGVASGLSVAGNIGGTERIEYTVMGNATNLASRLQDLTKEMSTSILLSESTYQSAFQLIEGRAQAIPGVSIRGKQEKVTIYSLN
jgi:adenylate cyclase